MALPSRYGIDKKINSMEGLSAYENGGKGSGNFGHSGRPGEVGGSSSGGSHGKTKKELQEEIEDLNIRISQAGVAKREGQKVDEGYMQDMMEERKALRAELDSAKEAAKKMGEELRKKSPVRKQDEWFTTLKQIDDEYEKRGKEMEDNAGEVESAIHETGETWTGPKQKALDLVKIGIRTNRDTFTDSDEFLEQTRGLFDDLKDVEGFKAKTVDVYEHPMSASGIVIQEHKKK